MGGANVADSYELCRRIHRDHGRSYYRATALLPARRRLAVHALYACTRVADDIVDEAAPAHLARSAAHAGPRPDGADRLATYRAALLDAVSGRPTNDPVLLAAADTINAYGLNLGEIEQFLHSMAMDLTVTRYDSYDDLLAYMEGSSAVIGTLMLPILGLAPGADPVLARYCARELGLGFQLTNFIRDVAEDLGRGRVYLPASDLARFGVTEAMLATDAIAGRASPAVRELVRFECDRARSHYAAALPGIALLERRSRVCIRAAFVLYGGILGEVARAGYDVMAGRAVVPTSRRTRLVLAAAAPGLFAAEVLRQGITR